MGIMHFSPLGMVIEMIEKRSYPADPGVPFSGSFAWGLSRWIMSCSFSSMTEIYSSSSMGISLIKKTFSFFVSGQVSLFAAEKADIILCHLVLFFLSHVLELLEFWGKFLFVGCARSFCKA